MRQAATTALVSPASSMAACGGGHALVAEARAASTPCSSMVSAAGYVYTAIAAYNTTHKYNFAEEILMLHVWGKIGESEKPDVM